MLGCSRSIRRRHLCFVWHWLCEWRHICKSWQYELVDGQCCYIHFFGIWVYHDEFGWWRECSTLTRIWSALNKFRLPAPFLTAKVAFLFRWVMLRISMAYAAIPCLSFVCHICVTCKRILTLLWLLGRHAILVFPYQTSWQYSDGPP